MRREFLKLVIGFSTVWLVGCKKESADKQSSGAPAAARIRLAVIPKGTTHEFWKSVHAGAVKAARELDVDIVWKGPLKEDDLKSQVDLVESFTAQKVSGILLAPLNDKALVSTVTRATQQKVPVVIFDSALSGGSPVSFVATDNRAAGRLAGERMLSLLQGTPGKLVVLRYQEGSASTHEREEGFLEAVRGKPGVEVVSDNQYGGATTESAFSASESLLLAKGADKGGVQGVFAPNESTTFGMLLALEKAKLAGKIRMIGFDASEKLLTALKNGNIDALVVQNPFNMGYLAIKAMVDHLKGQSVQARTDTGARVVDKTNLESPDVQELVKPNLAKWLSE